LQGGRFGEAGLRPHTIVESPDSVGLSAKEPMNLVDKRLDKATTHVSYGSNAAETVMPDGAVCPLLIR
jgi:hypothetical protein